MAKSPKKKTFDVTMRVVILTDTAVEADTFEQALEKAKALTMDDLVTIQTGCHDHDMHLVSVSDSDKWSTD